MAIPTFIGRHYVLSEADLAIYSDLLCDAFPGIRFFEHPLNSEKSKENPAPPTLRFVSSLRDTKQFWLTIVFDPSWQPTWHREEQNGWWVLEYPELPNGEIEKSGRIYSSRGGPLAMGGGRLYIRCKKGNKEHAAVGRKVVRLLTKVATTRSQGVRYPSLEVVWRSEKGAFIWIGHDASRWAREEPDRMLYYSSRAKIGIRPLD